MQTTDHAGAYYAAAFDHYSATDPEARETAGRRMHAVAADADRAGVTIAYWQVGDQAARDAAQARITVACRRTSVTDGPGVWVAIGCSVHGADAAHALMQDGPAGVVLAWDNHLRVETRAADVARASAQRLASPVSATCTADSGSATDCQPICTAPTAHRVTFDIPCYGTFVADVCARHVAYVRGQVHPAPVTVLDVQH
jgi:hypothetical protein